MATLGRLWAGRIYGTNTGNLFLQLECRDGQVTGTVHVLDSQYGPIVYRVEGRFNERLSLQGVPVQVQNGVEADTVNITAVLTAKGSLRGTWRGESGTAGTLEAFPHDVPVTRQPEVGSSLPPEQIYASSVQLGAIRLHTEDLVTVASWISKDFEAGRLVATYVSRGNEITRYFDDFIVDAKQVDRVFRFKLSAQEPEAHGINRVVVVDLNRDGPNEVRVQGIDEAWVTGKAESLARMLRSYESRLITGYKRFGLTTTDIILVSMLVVIPSIVSLWQRAVFAGIVIGLSRLTFWFHAKWIPTTVLYLGGQELGFFERLQPSLASWVIAATASLAAALAFALITGQLP